MNGMDWMASAMHAARAQLETATHNLANVSSDGYRRVSERLALTEHGIVSTTTLTHDQGAIRHTGRVLDLAIVGPGAFDVDGRRTRDGAFAADRFGYLTDARGWRVRGAAGPIQIGPDTRIDADGTVRSGAHVVNRIPLPPGSTLQSGALEASNVDAIGESIAILEAQRSFETAQKTLVAIDESRQKAVNDVVRLK